MPQISREELHSLNALAELMSYRAYRMKSKLRRTRWALEPMYRTALFVAEVSEEKPRFGPRTADDTYAHRTIKRRRSGAPKLDADSKPGGQVVYVIIALRFTIAEFH